MKGRCGKRYERCKKVCWGVGEVRGDVGKGEGGDVGKCVGAPHSDTFPYTSSIPFPTRQHSTPLTQYTLLARLFLPPPHPNTLPYTATPPPYPPYLFPQLPSPPPTPQHTSPLIPCTLPHLSPHLPPQF